MPIPGTDMGSYYRSIYRKLKSEHKNRKKAISKTYSLLHPAKHDVEEEDGAEKKTKKEYGPGEIPEEELEVRSDEYEKTVFINECIADLEIHHHRGHGARMASFASSYGKRLGKNLSYLSGRVLGRYLTGMSSDELKEVVRINESGIPEEKEAFWKKIFDEGKSVNLHEMDSKKPEVFLRNLYYKDRMAGMLSNFEKDFSGHIKDKNIIDQAKALYEAGYNNGRKHMEISQGLIHKTLKDE